jgi:hypothetical protein
MTWHQKDYSSRWEFWILPGGTIGWLGGISWQCFLGKRKTQKINPAYYLCIARNWFIMVWMVWLCRFCIRSKWLAVVQALGTTTVAACCWNGLGISR